MKDMINWLMEEESGQGMVEYALILALLALVVIVGLSGVGEKLFELLDGVEAVVPPERGT